MNSCNQSFHGDTQSILIKLSPSPETGTLLLAPRAREPLNTDLTRFLLSFLYIRLTVLPQLQSSHFSPHFRAIDSHPLSFMVVHLQREHIAELRLQEFKIKLSSKSVLKLGTVLESNKKKVKHHSPVSHSPQNSGHN